MYVRLPTDRIQSFPLQSNIFHHTITRGVLKIELFQPSLKLILRFAEAHTSDFGTLFQILSHLKDFTFLYTDFCDRMPVHQDDPTSQAHKRSRQQSPNMRDADRPAGSSKRFQPQPSVRIAPQTSQVFVKGHDGKTMVLFVDCEQPCSILKGLIFDKTGIPESHQCIQYQGKVVFDEQRLAERGVSSGSTLMLSLSVTSRVCPEHAASLAGVTLERVQSALTAKHFLCAWGLLRQGPSVLHYKSADVTRPVLMAAIEDDALDIVATHLDSNPGRDLYGPLLMSCIEQAENEAATFILSKLPDLAGYVSKDSLGPLHVAAHHGNVPMLQQLLAPGAQVDTLVGSSRGISPLYFAMAQKQLEASYILVEHGAAIDPQRPARSPLDAYEDFADDMSETTDVDVPIVPRSPVASAFTLANLFDCADFSDVTFVVGGRRISAHRCVLASRCEFFRRMFMGPMREATMREIDIPDCDFAVFRALLHFVYTAGLP
eukprot:TRINITY_DN7261_c1_g1_i1.p1 TRINITY_DN7261_c1_g1~~TRINITY_DN7261_c1_g1_i1.p1  ORF type:complete len:488 (+),score=74.45 TRINITY_DN7261_c1_g1_i1:172-1635(+)